MQKKSFLNVLASVALLSSTTMLMAETPSDADLLEEVPPPPTIQEGEPLDQEPEITIKKKGKETVEEYRMNGELYMIKVTPEHGLPYYLYKEDAQSDWVNVGPKPPLSVPKWTLFRF